MVLLLKEKETLMQRKKTIKFFYYVSEKGLVQIRLDVFFRDLFQSNSFYYTKGSVG